MARFTMTVIKEGTVNEEENYTLFAAVSAVELDEGDDVLCFPEEYLGLPVTHIGYVQGYQEGRMEYGDWHHPTHRADEYIPPRHFAQNAPIRIPETVKRVVVPKHVDYFDARDASEEGGVAPIYEVDPENKRLGVSPEGRVMLKCFIGK